MLAFWMTVIGLVASSLALGVFVGFEVSEKKHKRAREVKEVVLPPFFK